MMRAGKTFRWFLVIYYSLSLIMSSSGSDPIVKKSNANLIHLPFPCLWAPPIPNFNQTNTSYNEENRQHANFLTSKERIEIKSTVSKIVNC